MDNLLRRRNMMQSGVPEIWLPACSVAYTSWLISNGTSVSVDDDVVTIVSRGTNWNDFYQAQGLLYKYADVKDIAKIRISYDYELSDCVSGGYVSNSPYTINSVNPNASSGRHGYTSIGAISQNGIGHFVGDLNPVLMTTNTSSIQSGDYLGFRIYVNSGSGSTLKIWNLKWEIAFL